MDVVVFPECGLVGCYSRNRSFVIKEVASVVPNPGRDLILCQEPHLNQVSSILPTIKFMIYFTNTKLCQKNLELQKQIVMNE